MGNVLTVQLIAPLATISACALSASIQVLLSKMAVATVKMTICSSTPPLRRAKRTNSVAVAPTTTAQTIVIPARATANPATH